MINPNTMISGTHVLISSKNAEADKAFFRDILKLTNVDVGHGWLIFGLPPSELAVHPASDNNQHEIYLMCDDIEAFVQQMSKQKITCSNVQDHGYGLFVKVTLPGGGKLGVYQPRHARPKPVKAKATISKVTAKTRQKGK
jgi:hypothetical protein